MVNTYLVSRVRWAPRATAYPTLSISLEWCVCPRVGNREVSPHWPLPSQIIMDVPAWNTTRPKNAVRGDAHLQAPWLLPSVQLKPTLCGWSPVCLRTVSNRKPPYWTVTRESHLPVFCLETEMQDVHPELAICSGRE